MTEKVKGPASYFPSIEKAYNQPHMQIVQYLKDAHKMGHGHANAIVAHQLAKMKGASK
jgi:hypothetical protein